MMVAQKLVWLLLCCNITACMYGLVPVTPDTVQQHIYDQEKPVVLIAYAYWCTVCEITRGFLDNIYPQFQDRAVFAMLEVNQNPDFAIKYTITFIPTFLVFYRGELICEHKGFIQPYKLRSHVEQFLSKIEQNLVIDEPLKDSEQTGEITENSVVETSSE